MHRRTFYSFALVVLLLSTFLPGSLQAGPQVAGPADLAAAGPPTQVQVDPYLLEQMAAAPDGQAGFFVLFSGQADLSPAYRIADWTLRGRFVYDALRATAERAQAPAREWLQAQGIAYTPLLSNNSLFVTGDRPTMEALAALPGVVGIRGNHQHELEPQEPDPNKVVPTGVAWGITRVGADRVWHDFGVRGQSIVVANIDTGVDYTHVALVNNYKCGAGPHDKCWSDPSGICESGDPCDNVGHGTHTMGTMVGDDDPGLTYNVGMAPEARWIACKGCESNSCSEYALLSCADWVLAPGGDAADRPHVVNNSWGGYGCDTWYQASVQAWRAAGIFPAFSAGNSGSSCGSLGSPGDYPESFNSGAVDADDAIAYFSSRGPSCWDEIKPEVTAPGVDVCSSIPGNLWACYYSGTSMASPHTAGLVALLWDARPSLVGDIAATERLITSTATCIADSSCGGSGCPNNVYGWGRIDAYAAVQLVASSGTLAGTVTDGATTAPLPGVQITARLLHGGSFDATTGPSGAYSLTLPAGVYTVSASLYAYYPQTVTAVLIVTDVTTVQDLSLLPLPRYTVSGTVVEAETGTPLQARIEAEGAPVAPAWSDPLTGYYSLTLIAGSYSLRASALLHLSDRTLLQVDGDRTANFELESSRCALLVDDDDNRPDVRSYYTSTIDQFGLPYRVWDVAEKGPVGSEDLMGSRIVIWWTGADRQDTITPDDETALATYLDGWGNLFLSSAGYLNETDSRQQQGGGGGGPANTALQNYYLRLGSYSLELEQNDPLGNNGDPIGDGLGPFLLVPPDGWSGSLGTDGATPADTAGASAPFRWQALGVDNSTDYDAGSFKTVFLAWPVEGLAGPSSRRAVLESVLNFFGACQPVGLLLGRVTDANTGAGLADVSVMPVREGLEAAPAGNSDDDGYFTFTLPAGSYEVTIYSDGYVPEVRTGITVPAGAITRLDVALRSPRLSYRPDRFAWELPWEATTTDTLVISNSGTAAPLEWQVWANASSQRQQWSPLPRAPLQRTAGGSPVDEPPAGLSSTLAQPAGWELETPLPTGRCRGASFTSSDGSVFAVGGFGDSGGGSVCLNENLRYDVGSGQWIAAAPLPLARSNLQAAVVDGIAYLPAGYCDDYYYNDLQAYDMEADHWLSGLAPLPAARSGNMVTALDGLVYSCGGNPSGYECWAYDPAQDSWEQAASLPGENAYGAMVEHDGFLYLVGGSVGLEPAAVFWRYDPSSSSWSAGPPMHIGRMSPGVAVYGDYLYVSGGGGEMGNIWNPYDSVERYPLWQWPTASWEYVADPLYPPVVAPLGACSADRVRIIGGWAGWSSCTEHQTLDEGMACYSGGTEQAAWVTPTPISGSLEVGQEETVTLLVDANAVDEPGCYQGSLAFRDNSVYGPSSIPLTLCVVPTADLGKLSGSVQGLGYCDRYPEALSADVRIEGSGGVSWTLPAGSGGNFFKWLHAGVYTVSVEALGYVMQSVTVQVQPMQTETLDLDLHYLTSCLDIELTEFTLYVPTGTQLQRTLLLTNAGDLALSWQAEEAVLPAGMAVPMGRHISPWETGGRSGGPDSFGYTYRDSNVPGGPAFAWLEASHGGIKLSMNGGGGGDDLTTTLPFTLTFYGVPYTPTRTLYVSRLGVLYFSGYRLDYEDCLPASGYTGVLSPWWDWMWYRYGEDNGTFYSVLGEAPHRTMVIEWHNAHVGYNEPTNTISLETVIFEGSGDILFQYADVVAGDSYADAGADASVGIQGDDTTYMEYSCDEPVLADSLSICFEPPGSLPGCGVSWEDTSWLSLSSSSGEVAPHRQAALDLLIDTTGLQPGVYQAAVGILSDDPRRPAVYIPVTLIVGLGQHIYLPLAP